MRFLVIGLGSMGKRRIKCLQKLGHYYIVGLDTDWSARDKVEIDTISDSDCVAFDKVDAMIICTPPNAHAEYIKRALTDSISTFVEQSVILEDLIGLDTRKIYIAPSCTMLFHPEIQKLRWKKIINFSYHVGQYLRDWHPDEDIKDFYVSDHETGGCKELVAFELNWMTHLFGFPRICGFSGETVNMGVHIDDTYAIAMDFGHCYGSMTVDVTSRKKIRHLTVNTPDEQIVLDLNITEKIYVDELKAFIKGVFPNTLKHDLRVLGLLDRLRDE